MYINGEFTKAESGKYFDVFNPADGSRIGQVGEGNEKDAQKAIESAAEAFASWSRTTAYQRSKYLYKAWEIMMAEKDRLAEMMTKEQGKPLRASQNEVRYGADFLLWFAEEAKRVYGETVPAPRPDQRFIVLRQPVGVVAAITPWNYPMSMITRKVAPALAAGCTIVLKPAEDTPLCAMEIFKILDRAGVPPGVANLVTARDPLPVAKTFIEHPRVRKITFTGSTEVGKELARNAADSMKRVSLELGGHAPFIVFEDADPVYAAKGAGLVKFLNTGQACISPNRFLVHKNLAEPFTETFKSRIAPLKAGNGMEPDVRIGPLVNEAAIEKVNRQVEDALDKGATLVCGGKRLAENGLDKGCFYAPTLIKDVTADMQIYREETFGPVAPVLTFETEEQALKMANDTRYGLASYVYTRDISRAFRMFENLQFGIVGINDINPTAAAAPFGGIKESGLGREGGKEGIEEYLETKLGGFSISG